MTTLKSIIEKENLAKKIENKHEKQNPEACPDMKKKKKGGGGNNTFKEDWKILLRLLSG